MYTSTLLLESCPEIEPKSLTPTLIILTKKTHTHFEDNIITLMKLSESISKGD